MPFEYFVLQCVIYALCYYIVSQIWFCCFLAAVRITYAVVRHIVLMLPHFVRVVKEAFRVSFSGLPMWLDTVFLLASIIIAICQVSIDEARRELWWYHLYWSY